MGSIIRGLADVVAWTFRQLWRFVAALARWTIASLDDLRQTSGATQAWLIAFFVLSMLSGAIMGRAAAPTPAPIEPAPIRPSAQPVAIVVTSTPRASPTLTLTRAPTSTPTPSATSGPSPTPGPTDTPRPTRTPTPTRYPSPTRSPEDALRESVMLHIGSGNRDNAQRVSDVSLSDGWLVVRFAINDNLFESWTVDSALEDCATILQVVAESGVSYDAVRIEGTFPMKDQYGNVSESIVINATWRKETIDKINWSGFRSENVLHIADGKAVHPSFDK